jgi:hypothetical protein
MNIVFAQLRKDLIPLRGLLIGMAALLAITLTGRILTATGVASFSGANPLEGIQVVLLAVLIVRLIHLDSLVGADAFWRTRPISRRQLLLAKAALLLLPILTLLAIAQPWLPPHPGAKGSFTDTCILLAGLAAFASVTQRFSELALLFLKAVLIALLMSLAINAVTATLLVGNQKGWFPPLGIPGTLPETLQLLTVILAIAGYIGVAIHQFLTMRTKRSVVALCSIFVLSMMMTPVIDFLRVQASP